MSGNDEYDRLLLLLGDTAEIFGFTFWYTDALSSVSEISIFTTRTIRTPRFAYLQDRQVMVDDKVIWFNNVSIYSLF